MPKSIEFKIPGKPGTKQRARKGQHGFYTPEQTVNYEDFIKWIYLKKKNRLWFTGPLMISIVAYFKTPKSSQVKTDKMLSGVIKHTVKPDVDNILKIVMDGLTGAAYADDKMVTECYRLKKVYTNEAERVEVILTSYINEDVKEIKK